MKSMKLPPPPNQSTVVPGFSGAMKKIPPAIKRDDSLIPLDHPQEGQAESAIFHREKNTIIDIDLDLIDPSPFQPRFLFEEDKIAELAESIGTSGQVTPIIVREIHGGRYELVGGERRTRALRLLNKTTVEAVIRNLSDDEAALLAIIDNESRENLTDFERGKGYKRLIDEKRVMSQTHLAMKIGRSNATITRCLAYFRLPTQAIRMLDDQPNLIGNKVVSDFAKLHELGFTDVVLKFLDHIQKGKYSQEIALNYAKSEVDYLMGKKAEKPIPKKLVSSGRPVAEFRFEGKRDVVLRCERGIDPAIFIEKFEEFLRSDPILFKEETSKSKEDK